MAISKFQFSKCITLLNTDGIPFAQPVYLFISLSLPWQSGVSPDHFPFAWHVLTLDPFISRYPMSQKKRHLSPNTLCISPQPEWEPLEGGRREGHLTTKKKNNSERYQLWLAGILVQEYWGRISSMADPRLDKHLRLLSSFPLYLG